MLNGFLVHLSMNMWEDWPSASEAARLAEGAKAWMRDNIARMPRYFAQRRWSDHRKFDDALWHELLPKLAEAGVNAIFFDLADGYRWQSHPELALPEAWTPKQLKAELDLCRSYGITPYPKINFSSTHDAWLRDFSRMLSTRPYYIACRELIEEAMEAFGAPGYFHLGMDEEGEGQQSDWQYAVYRQGDLWWHDLEFLLDIVRKTGARPWMWSDKAWHCGIGEFKAHVPIDVIQNNWIYTGDFEGEFAQKVLPLFRQLDEAGYTQVPTGSNWSSYKNYRKLVDYCMKNISGERLLGFMNAPWYATTEDNRDVQEEAVRQITEAGIPR